MAFKTRTAIASGSDDPGSAMGWTRRVPSRTSLTNANGESARICESAIPIVHTVDPTLEHLSGSHTRLDRDIGNSQIKLLIPAGDVTDPELSIVIPALNEELTIAEFVDWCKEGLRRANVRGEILIIDSSSDGTAEIALARRARVLKTPKRGLGRAYIDAIPYIRGKYIILATSI